MSKLHTFHVRYWDHRGEARTEVVQCLNHKRAREIAEERLKHRGEEGTVYRVQCASWKPEWLRDSQMRGRVQ